MFDYFEPFVRMGPLFWDRSSVVDYGRRCLSMPHRSERRSKGQRAKARRKAKNKR